MQGVPGLLLAEILSLLDLWHLVFILWISNSSLFRDNFLFPIDRHVNSVHRRNELHCRKQIKPILPLLRWLLFTRRSWEHKLPYHWLHSPYRRLKCTKEKITSIKILSKFNKLVILSRKVSFCHSKYFKK